MKLAGIISMYFNTANQLLMKHSVLYAGDKKGIQWDNTSANYRKHMTQKKNIHHYHLILYTHEIS
jgi:hypothetical protein